MASGAFIRQAFKGIFPRRNVAANVAPFSHPVVIQQGHLSSTPALMNLVRVQGKAPDFSANAVVNGEFKEISLKNYQGSVVFF